MARPNNIVWIDKSKRLVSIVSLKWDKLYPVQTPMLPARSIRRIVDKPTDPENIHATTFPAYISMKDVNVKDIQYSCVPERTVFSSIARVYHDVTLVGTIANRVISSFNIIGSVVEAETSMGVEVVIFDNETGSIFVGVLLWVEICIGPIEAPQEMIFETRFEILEAVKVIVESVTQVDIFVRKLTM